MRRTGTSSGRQVRRADTVHREAAAVVDRRGTAGQGDQTAIVEGARDQLYVQAAEDHVPVAVLYRSAQRKRSRFVFTSKPISTIRATVIIMLMEFCWRVVRCEKRHEGPRARGRPYLVFEV